MYKYGIIGNCHISAYVSDKGSIDWLCLPRVDSEPIFGKLLDPDGGFFNITLEHESRSHQYYLNNTNILITEIWNKNGDGIRIRDFSPRFEQHGRLYRPASIFRIVEPIGSVSIKVKCSPVTGWNKEKASPVRGNSHIRFDIRGEPLRLITNMPLTYLCEEHSFRVTEKLYFGLSWSYGIEEDIISLTERFYQQTADYWKMWVKHCAIPTQFQKETIRSALALKLHCYEDTGAILAALSTSLPEIHNGVRNWDYRYCWLRDAYFVLSAFQNLGHFEEMEGFLKFLLDLASHHESSPGRLAPVYTLSKDLPLPETIHDNWNGFSNSKPVRSFNQAAEHIQNDVYGEMILSFTPIYLDERFAHLRSQELENLLIKLGNNCALSISQPDAGLWEIRNGWQEHSFSNLLCWAGLDRLKKIQGAGFLKNSTTNYTNECERAINAVLNSASESIIRNSPNDLSLDASLSLMALLRFPRSELVNHTILAIEKELSMKNHPSYYFRYVRDDDFGKPESAFVVCSFWMIQALMKIGHKEKAMEILKTITTSANHLGLFSEHFDPKNAVQLGNFPQAYSHVGMINAAFAVSPPWSEVL